MSITSLPRERPAATPFEANSTFSTSGVSGTIRITTSDFSATALASGTTSATARMSSASEARSGTISECFALCRLSAMGRPMMPRPMNPIFMVVSLNSEFLAPFQAGDGIAGRAVFASDPAAIAEFIHPSEHEAPTDLPGSRLIARGDVGDLHVRDHRPELFHAFGDVAFGRLAMINVELQAKPVASDGLDDGGALRLGIQKVSRHVAVIDRLDHQHHACLRRVLRRPGQGRCVDAGRGDLRHASGHDPRHAVHQLAAQRARIAERLLDAVMELRLATGKAGQAALAPGPIAWRHVEQSLGQAFAIQPLA